jgi:acyl-CoA synthetase (NDP forming)
MSPGVPPADLTGRPVRLRELDLDRFFRPRTVAVVGASDTPGRPNTAMYQKISAWAAAAGAAVYPVNPNRDQVGGRSCYASLAQVPAELDLVVVLTGDPLPSLEAAIEKKARFAVVFAAGFAEVGGEGERLQRAMEEMVRASELHVLGPNTNLNAFEEFRQDLAGPAIALITQSGHQGRPVFQGQELGIRLSHWAPTGNEADLEVADFIRYFADQPEVGAIACYVEGFKDGRTLMLAADHAATRGVPVVAVKVGRTEEGRSMARAHTGHLTGADAVVSAAFRQLGVTRVDGLDELLDVSAALARTKPPRGEGVCIYSISGGTGAHMADLAAAAGLKLPRLSAATQQQLHEWIPPYLRVSNPVDNGGPPSADWRGRKILDAILADPAVDLLICPITGALPSMGNRLAKDLVEAAESTDKAIFVIWGSPVGDEPAYREILCRSQVPTFRTFSNAVRAARAYFDYHAFRRRHRPAFARPLRRRSPGYSPASQLLGSARSQGRSLSEAESKALLGAYGVPTTTEAVCTSRAEAARAAARIGLPVVMKVCSPRIEHKSDLGLVAVGVASEREVRSTYDALVERSQEVAPGVGLDGVLVSEMVTGATECLAGVATDELFGPVVVFGWGGVLAEVLADVSFRVPPFSRDEARRMVAETKVHALLRGGRGRPPASVPALVEVIMRLQRLSQELYGELAELDVNPLAVTPTGAVALDALAVPAGLPRRGARPGGGVREAARRRRG